MKRLLFKKIDAFTDGSSSGNPAGYIYLGPGDYLNEREMQRVAAELKGFVNEVGYVYREGKRLRLKYYSSECEVAFCGHATIAIMYDLISSDPGLIGEPELEIEVNAGILPVFNHIKDENAVYIMAPAPEFLERDIALYEAAEAMNADRTAFDQHKPFQVIDGGLRTLILPTASLDECLKLYPDQEKLKRFCLEKEIDIVLVFTDETSTSAKYRTRVFAPKYGYLEDQATGSGNSAFGYYLSRDNIWPGDFTIEQGASRINPNYVKLKRRQKDGNDRMLFGGCGTKRIEGFYCLHNA